MLIEGESSIQSSATISAQGTNFVPAIVNIGTSKVFHFKFDENGGGGGGGGGGGLFLMGDVFNEMGFNDPNQSTIDPGPSTSYIASGFNEMGFNDPNVYALGSNGSEESGSLITQVLDSVSNVLYDISGTASWITGVPDINDNVSALEFAGSTHILLPDVFDYPIRPSLTISLWFKTTSTDVGILGQGSGGTPGGTPPSNFVPAIFIDSSGNLRSSIFWHDDNQSQNISQSAVNDGNWKHLVCTFRCVVGGYYESLYIDGTLQDEQYVSQVDYSSTYYYWLGSAYGNGWGGAPTGWMFFEGALDDFRVYHTELSQADITSLASGGEPVNDQGISSILTCTGEIISATQFSGFDFLDYGL